ncbi:hypothetical protein M1446_03900 [Candidatus Dependentiae bacterium]|nr:hypothetical protein [Candidatus Dependentiae bacterium]
MIYLVRNFSLQFLLPCITLVSLNNIESKIYTKTTNSIVAKIDKVTGVETSYSPSRGDNQNSKFVAKPKKKILILSSIGGYCHTAAAEALQSMLEDKYDISIVNFFDEILHPVDTINTLTFGTMGGEEAYNTLLRNGWIKTINFFTLNIAPYLFQWNRDPLIDIAKKYFEEVKPDLIVSIVPFLNGNTIEAAKELNIPYFLITLDDELTTWLLGINKISYSKFYISVWHDNPELISRIQDTLNIPRENILLGGFPLRKYFFEQQNKQELKKEFNINQDKFVIMMMMGGAGGNAAYRYTKMIMNMDENIHLIVVTGKNAALARRLSRIKKKGKVDLTVLGFTKRTADLMAVSDLLIGKAGSGTFNEAKKMKLPILVDNTGSQLFWEKPNIEMVKKYNLGATVDYISDLRPLILEFIERKVKGDSNYLAAFSDIEKTIPTMTPQNIKKIIGNIMWSSV